MACNRGKFVDSLAVIKFIVIVLKPLDSYLLHDTETNKSKYKSKLISIKMWLRGDKINKVILHSSIIMTASTRAIPTLFEKDQKTINQKPKLSWRRENDTNLDNWPRYKVHHHSLDWTVENLQKLSNYTFHSLTSVHKTALAPPHHSAEKKNPASNENRLHKPSSNKEWVSVIKKKLTTKIQT